MSMSSKNLLPLGFYDLIDDEALLDHRISNNILESFLNSDYNLVKTSFLEFEEVLNNHQKLNQESFHFFDASLAKSLIFRNDITVQILRLLKTRLKNKTMPIRLCYLGDILKVSNDNLQNDRQMTQAGIELIGQSDDKKGIDEILRVSLNAARTINLQELVIEFCLPNFLDSLLEDLKIANNPNLKSAIEEKNIAKIKDLSGEYSDSLIELALEINDLEKITKILIDLNISQKLLSKYNNIIEIIKNSQNQYNNVKILLNIFADSEFVYHQDIAFTIFTEKFNYPILKGGKYQIEKGISAFGSSFYINYLRNALSNQ